jgi:hypothetical protein
MGKDLDGLGTKFMPGGGAFLTSVETGKKAIGTRKASQNPSMPAFDFQSGQG